MPAGLHPMKRETFDLSRRINVDPKGFERAVDVFDRTEFGLYMARGADHPHFGYLESWLLPTVSLRVNVFHFRSSHPTDQVLYTDIAAISRDADSTRWSTRDLYVDLISRRDGRLDIDDVDELAEACAAGLISAADTERAMRAALTAVSGAAAHGGDLLEWLRSQGLPLTWATAVTLSPPMSE